MRHYFDVFFRILLPIGWGWGFRLHSEAFGWPAWVQTVSVLGVIAASALSLRFVVFNAREEAMNYAMSRLLGATVERMKSTLESALLFQMDPRRSSPKDVFKN